MCIPSFRETDYLYTMLVLHGRCPYCNKKLDKGRCRAENIDFNYVLERLSRL